MAEVKGDVVPVVDSEKSADGTLTVSSDQLICKTPQRSSAQASLVKCALKKAKGKGYCDTVLYLGIVQILLGLLMSVFGVLVIVHDASLSQLGGGLWGGCLAVGAGTAGILAAAKNWCPLRTGAQKVAQTVFLALSLVSLAIAQLVLVLAATGLARDIQKTEIIEIKSEDTSADPQDIVEVLPSNYPALLSNTGLLAVSALQCICAAVASYKGARIVCPCFRSGEDGYYQQKKLTNGRESLVSSWLGNHTPPPHIYLVHTTSTLGKHSKLSGGLPVTPVFAMPQPPSVISAPIYPLIPAPLGPVPSPIIPAQRREIRRNHHHRRYQAPVMRSKSRSNTPRTHTRSQSKEKIITEADVARTYTGLDRTIAEEFIEICDSRNNSLCSDSSCKSSCHCGSQSGCTGCTSCTSDLGSRDYLIDK